MIFLKSQSKISAAFLTFEKRTFQSLFDGVSDKDFSILKSLIIRILRERLDVVSMKDTLKSQ